MNMRPCRNGFSSITKVENAFMAWVGGVNEASGSTKTLSGVLNGVAGHIDAVATAAGALVTVGVARYFGNMASGGVCHGRTCDSST